MISSDGIVISDNKDLRVNRNFMSLLTLSISSADTCVESAKMKANIVVNTSDEFYNTISLSTYNLIAKI